MKIKFNEKLEPKHYDKKIITEFLWFPVRINNEIRWLEKATILYEYDIVYNGWEQYFDIDGDFDWVAIKFMDEEG